MQEAYTGAVIAGGCNTQVVESAKVELLTGDEVFELLADEAFLAAWEVLYAACPWATIGQAHTFVAAWYRINRQEQLPILVKAVQGEQLVGLLPLAKELQSTLITGAGGWDAEYQCWLTAAWDNEAFIKSALLQVRRRFPVCELKLRYIPERVPLAWVEADPQWRPYCVLKEHRRPLMEISEAYFEKELKKKNRREKINRLKRMGELSFRRITDLQTFVAVLDELTTQFDFRKGAMFNRTPFRDSGLTRELLLTLFEHKLLHATVLKLNDEVIASNVGAISGSWVHLEGLNTHAPAYGRYSPGILHFLMLGKLMAAEGYQVFDLTPGGDAYKEILANAYDKVYELRIGGRYSRLRDELRKAIAEPVKQHLQKRGIAPRSLKFRIYKMRERFRAAKRIGAAQLLKALSDRLRSGSALRVYLFDKQSAAMRGVEVKQNSLSDLLCFVQQGELRTRWDFLDDAERRLQAGERAFTWVEAGRLLCCGWLAPAGQSAGLSLPAGAVLLQGLYCHRQGRHWLQAFLEAVARQVDAPLYVASKSKALCSNLEEAGCRAQVLAAATS